MLHYLDDFLLLGAPDSPECARALEITIATCEELVISLAKEKLEGPVTSLTFILCHSDNSAVVSQINSLHARDPLACNILRCLALFQASFDFRVWVCPPSNPTLRLCGTFGSCPILPAPYLYFTHHT